MYLQKQELPKSGANSTSKSPPWVPQELCKVWRWVGTGSLQLPLLFISYASVSPRAYTYFWVAGPHSTISDLVCTSQRPTNVAWAGRFICCSRSDAAFWEGFISANTGSESAFAIWHKTIADDITRLVSPGLGTGWSLLALHCVQQQQLCGQVRESHTWQTQFLHTNSESGAGEAAWKINENDS